MYVIEAAGRCFLVGVGDGPMAMLAELDAAALPREPARGAAAVRRRARARCWGARAAAASRRRGGDVAARGCERGEGEVKPVPLMLAMAALSLVPFALLMVTCFVRISVVLSILRSAIGAPQVPPTQVLTGLALVLTLAVMAPTGERMLAAVAPVFPTLRRRRGRRSRERADGGGARHGRRRAPRSRCASSCSSTRARAIGRPSTPSRSRCAAPAERAGITDRDLAVIVPAFVTSELRRAFEIGFLLFIPFLVIDMVIANLLLALGMHMLSPTTVSLPFKLLLFVVADGWTLVVRGLMESYL